VTEFDERVMAHITRYPGLSMFEIGRALGVNKPGEGSNAKMLWALMHLMQDRRVRFEKVRAPAPGGYKNLWYPVQASAGPPWQSPRGPLMVSTDSGETWHPADHEGPG